MKRYNIVAHAKEMYPATWAAWEKVCAKAHGPDGWPKNQDGALITALMDGMDGRIDLAGEHVPTYRENVNERERILKGGYQTNESIDNNGHARPGADNRQGHASSQAASTAAP